MSSASAVLLGKENFRPEPMMRQPCINHIRKITSSRPKEQEEGMGVKGMGVKKPGNKPWKRCCLTELVLHNIAISDSLQSRETMVMACGRINMSVFF